MIILAAVSVGAAACGGSGPSSNPTCFPGGQQSLTAPSPGSENAPSSRQTVYIASSVALDPNNYRIVLLARSGSYIYGSPARAFGPVPSPTPPPGGTVEPTPFPGTLFYETRGFVTAADKVYTVYITGNNCSGVQISGASFLTGPADARVQARRSPL